MASWGSERPRILALYHCCVVLSDQRTELMGGDVMSWHSAVIKTNPNPPERFGLGGGMLDLFASVTD